MSHLDTETRLARAHYRASRKRNSSVMASIAENQIHKATLTMPFDLAGETLEIVYVDGKGNVTTGGTATGKAEGEEVSITTDLEQKGIDPGHYRLEVKYDDSGTTRELGLQGDERLLVNDAASVS